MTTSPLAYITRGDRANPPIVFLHGLLGSGAEWDEITALLADSYFCIQIDLPGHGESRACSPDMYPMPACAAAVVAVLDSLSIPAAGLCGYSMGGRLGYYLLTHHTDRFDRAVLESASPGLVTEPERLKRITHDNDLAHRLERDGIGPFLVYWFRQPLFATLAANPELLKKVTALRFDNDPQTAARSLRAMGTGTMPDLRPLIAAIDRPLLLITGEHDAKFTALAQEIIGLCPKATHCILKESGHNAHIEQPHAFVQTLKAFFL